MRNVEQMTVCLALTLVALLNVPAALIQSNGTGGGEWTESSTWQGGTIPSSTTDVLIQTDDHVTVWGMPPILRPGEASDPDDPVSCHSLTIEPGATLTHREGGYLLLYGTSFNNSGTFNAEPDSIIAIGSEFSGTVAGSATTEFEKVNVHGSVDFGVRSIIHSQLTVYRYSNVVGNGPFYGPNSVLQYFGSKHTSAEWGSGAVGDQAVPPRVNCSWFYGETDMILTLRSGVAHTVTGDLEINSPPSFMGGVTTLVGTNASLEILGDFGMGEYTDKGTFQGNGTEVIFNGDGTSTCGPFLPEAVFGDITVPAGMTLMVEGDCRSSGTIRNRGTIRSTQEIPEENIYSFDLIPRVMVDVYNLGSVASLELAWMGFDHPGVANSQDQHWLITPDTPSDEWIYLWLPYSGISNPRVYHHLGGENWESGVNEDEGDLIAFFSRTPFTGAWFVGGDSECDLAVANVESADPIPPAQSVLHTVTVTNTGSEEATGAVASVELFGGAQVASVQWTHGTVNTTTDPITATIGNLSAGEVASMEIEVYVKPETLGTIAIAVTAEAQDVDFNSGNNSLAESTDVEVTLEQIVDSLIGTQTPELPFDTLNVNDDAAFDAADVTTTVNEMNAP